MDENVGFYALISNGSACFPLLLWGVIVHVPTGCFRLQYCIIIVRYCLKSAYRIPRKADLAVIGRKIVIHKRLFSIFVQPLCSLKKTPRLKNLF